MRGSKATVRLICNKWIKLDEALQSRKKSEHVLEIYLSVDCNNDDAGYYICVANC